MSKKKMTLFLFVLLWQMSSLFASAVTYELSGGRLGDNIIAYLHAKWISHKYGIPLLYKPFEYSDEFALNELEVRYDTVNISRFRKIMTVFDESYINVNNGDSVLYVVPYFPESECERMDSLFKGFSTNWKDEMFKRNITKLLYPLKNISLCECPKDKTTVAIHYRTGGTYEQNLGAFIPIKFPPEEFYLDQIDMICKNFPEEKIHFHIFTDDQNPLRILELFQSHFKEDRLSFSCRSKDNAHNQNVLDDLFSMIQFDCLIRPESNFSIVASLLKNYKILAHPDGVTNLNGKLKINKVRVIKEPAF